MSVISQVVCSSMVNPSLAKLNTVCRLSYLPLALHRLLSSFSIRNFKEDNVGYNTIFVICGIVQCWNSVSNYTLYNLIHSIQNVIHKTTGPTVLTFDLLQHFIFEMMGEANT